MASGGEPAPGGDPTEWLQGSLLPADTSVQPQHWVHVAAPETRLARGAVTDAQRGLKEGQDLPEILAVGGGLKDGDRLMVISQTCDLVKPASELPQLEVARVFVTDNPKILAQASHFGSARYQRVSAPNMEPVWVLDYGQRALLEKGFLRAYAPDNSIASTWTPERAAVIARWLGRRYSRPAIPDEDYKEVTEPIRQRWMRLIDEEAELAAELSSAYPELRYRREDDGHLTIYTLALEEHPDEALALELYGVLQEALEPVHGTGNVSFPTEKRSYHSFTQHDEMSSTLIDLEWASHDETEPTGALPAS